LEVCLLFFDQLICYGKVSNHNSIYVINVKYFFLLATIKIPVFVFGCNLSYTSCSSAS